MIGHSRFRVSAVGLTAATLLLATLGGGCYGTSPSHGGGQTKFDGRRHINPADISLPAGYRIEAIASGLTFPTAVVFDDRNNVYVVEAGYSYGEVWRQARLLRLEPGGGFQVVAADDDNNGPWTGATYHDGGFYVCEGGHRLGGRVLRINPARNTTDVVVDGLPSLGDHHTNGPAVGPDGKIYFGQGTATNSGVVGPDNAKFGWFKRHPDFHDIPGKDIRLAGRNYTTSNPLTKDKNDKATTGAYMPFGTAAQEGQVVQGRLPCTGAIMRINAAGGDLELVAWGLRNPYGLAFAPDGRLFVTENSYDVRGSRPVWGTGDVLWAVDPKQVLWYGWPDFHGGMPLTRADHFTAPGKPPPRPLLAEHPNPPPRPVAKLGVHSSSNGIDFAPGGRFGHDGEAFIAQFGDMAPAVGKVMAPVGYKIVRVNPQSGVINDFAANKGSQNGPASKLKTGGFERPTDVRFSPDGDALYVVDFGVMTMDATGPKPRPGTGVLWRITREGGQPQ